MNADVQEWLRQNTAIQEDARRLAAGLSDAQFNWSPAVGRWSIGQCLDHLNISNAKQLALLETGIARGRVEGRLGDGPFRYGLVSRLFRRIMEPPVRLRWVKAPPPFQTAADKAAAEVTGEFQAIHERLIEALRQADGLDLPGVRVTSAFNDKIDYSLGMAFWIMAAHDRRHLWQAWQVRRSPGFPA